MSVDPSSVPWLTLSAFASGIGALFLVRYLYGYRDQAGVSPLDDPSVGVDVDVPPTAALDTDERLLRVVLANLFESCLEYADRTPDLEVEADDRLSSAFARVEVRMVGAAIPDHEIAVVEDGEETALNHSSGMGLWFVKWGISTLGGDIDFETSGGETSIRLQLPVADEPGGQ